jgi:hypothetical protein
MPSSVEEILVGHWSDFEGVIQPLTSVPEDDQSQTNQRLYAPVFRGVGNSCWGLETTLERSYPTERCDETLSLLKYYRKIFAAKAALETLSGRRWDKLPDSSTFEKLLKDHWSSGSSWLDHFLSEHPEICDYLVYLRHHGFPSPLLDWTASPYVAALFAFEMVPENVKRVSVYAALPRAPEGSSDQHFFLVRPYMRTHKRHFVQQCSYSMCVGLDERKKDYVFLPHELATADDPGPVERWLKFTIPAKERRVALQHLDLMNINPFSLFGSEDSLVRTIARRECYFKNWQ